MRASHPPLSPPTPPRLEKAGRCMPSSTSTVLAPSLPLRAPVTTSAPQNIDAGRTPHSVQMFRLGPKSGHHPGHGAGAGTWAEPGVRLPSGQFQDLGPPPLCVTWFSPRKQLNLQTGGARTSSCFVQPQTCLVTSWHLGSLGLTLQSRLNLEWAPCPASPLIQVPQGRGGRGESGTPRKNRWHVC